MAKEIINNVKLGILVLAGILVLIVTLYFVGKSRNFFGSNYTLRARFSDINGLMPGNNVRYSGIQIGTVSKILVVNDTIIEVQLSVKENMQPHIHSNTMAGIGSDGLMGNKVVNLTPAHAPAPVLEEGGMLSTQNSTGTDQVMKTLSSAGDNIEQLSQKLITTVDQLNNSSALWTLLNDSTIPVNLKKAMGSLNETTDRINEMSRKLNSIAGGIQEGNGAVGKLLTDKEVAENTRGAVENFNNASRQAKEAIARVNTVVTDIQHDLANGKGIAHTLLKDTVTVSRLNNSMQHIESGTESFSESMEALKHNFLLRGYFKRKARREKRASN